MSSLPILVPPHSMHHSTLFTPPIIIKPDSGASGTYVREQDATVLSSIVPSTSHQVMLPDGNNIQSTKKGLLPIPGLSDVAATAHVFKDLHSASLLSVGQLCDDDCLVLFDKEFMRVFKHNKEILRGHRNFRDRLWDVNINPASAQHHTSANQLPINTANVIIRKETTIRELIQYFQGCCFSPTKSTFLQAVKNGNFITWPGLTATAVEKHYKRTIYVAKGHLNQERQGLQSTKEIPVIPLSPEEEFLINNDYFPHDENLQQPTHDALAAIIPFEARMTGYSDLTGRFPFKSSRGNQYVLVVYDYDSNAILAEAIPNRQAASIRDAFIKIVNKLSTRGAKPNICHT